MPKKFSNLTSVITNTIRYFDLFDQPLTAVQLWQLQVGAAGAHSLGEVRQAAEAAVDSGALATKFGYYFLPRRQSLVRTWLRRHALAQEKWKLTRRIARWLQYVPFVRMIAMSGSLAAGNTRPTSDLDLFVVVATGRIWLARFGLLVVTELLGRRRRHWDRVAPDKICLNHYVTDKSLAVSADIRNIYTAVLYRSLISLTGDGWRQKFVSANEDWMRAYVIAPPQPDILSQHALPGRRDGRAAKQVLEYFGREPVFDWLEYAAEAVQRWVITRHTDPTRPGRVVINNRELAFHPDTKVPALLGRYYKMWG